MTLLVFAFGAGMLSTVNPCGFAMLPAFLAYYVGDGETGSTRNSVPLLNRLGQGFGVGLAVSGGFAGVFTVAGLLVSFGLRSLVRAVPWAAVLIGSVMVILGLVLVAGRQVGLRIGKDLGPGSGRSYRRMVVFGAAYAVASLSCTLAVLLAVVAQATATSNPFQLIGVFIAYGLGAASILVALSVGAALAKAAVARTIRRLLPVVSRLGGAVLVASGLYMVAYWLPSLIGSGPDRSVTGPSGGLSARFTSFLDVNQDAVVALGAALAILGVAVGLLLRRRAILDQGQADVGDCCTEQLVIEPVTSDHEHADR